ncbi:MAG TPA: hypothetical protein VGE79_05205 [Niastella sp.]
MKIIFFAKNDLFFAKTTSFLAKNIPLFAINGLFFANSLIVFAENDTFFARNTTVFAKNTPFFAKNYNSFNTRNVEAKKVGDRKGFTTGVGLYWNDIRFNFSYLAPSGNGITRNTLSNTVRFGLVYVLKC